MFIKKKQPSPIKQPLTFLLSSTPLFFGVYVALKLFLSVVLFVFLSSLANDSFSYDGGLINHSMGVIALVVGLLDVAAWTLMPALMYKKKNGARPLFIALNTAIIIGILFVLVYSAVAQGVQ